METVIREATADDYEALCELFDEVDALHRDHLPHFFRRPTGPVRDQAYYQGLITDENTGLLLFYRKLGYETVSQRMSPSLD